MDLGDTLQSGQAGLIGGTPASEGRLARLAAAGNKAAFAAIFRRYHQPLYRYCRAITGNAEDASDALQNTMLRALKALPGERREIALKPWLYRVAHNESVSVLRRRRPEAPLDAAAEASLESPHEQAATREQLRELALDLRELPEPQRAALLLHELSGLSFAEVAVVLGTSTSAAKQAAYHARAALHDFATGRAMNCDLAMRAISDADGRRLRERGIRAHLRACAGCRSFREACAARPGQLNALAPPLPAVAAAALLQKLLSGGGAAGSGSGGLGAAAGAKLATGVGTLKTATAVVAAVAVGVGGVGAIEAVRSGASDRAHESSAGAAARAARHGIDPAHSKRATGDSTGRHDAGLTHSRAQAPGRAARHDAADAAAGHAAGGRPAGVVPGAHRVPTHALPGGRSGARPQPPAHPPVRRPSQPPVTRPRPTLPSTPAPVPAIPTPPVLVPQVPAKPPLGGQGRR